MKVAVSTADSNLAIAAFECLELSRNRIDSNDEEMDDDREGSEDA